MGQKSGDSRNRPESGSESWARDPEEDGRASAFHNYRSVCIEDAGHWVHHDQLEEFMDVALPFLTSE